MDGLLRKVDDRLDAIMRPLYGPSHASNLLELPDGRLLLVWFTGGNEGEEGIRIVSSYLEPGSTQWTKPTSASFAEGRSNQNPVIFYHEPDKTVRLLHTSQVAYEGQGTADVRIVESNDGGATWGAPKVLFTENGAFVKNQLIQSKDGSEWLLPMYYTPDGFLGHETQYSVIKRSADGGRTWQEHVMQGTHGNCVQPTVVRLASGTLRAWFRSRAADYIYVSDSEDDGRTWSPPRKTALPNNNSGIQACRLSNGGIVMVFNNVQGPFSRYPLTVALSLDDGASWPYLRDLEPTKDAAARRAAGQVDLSAMGEFSYPSVIQTRDGGIHVSYTYNRESIRYAKITEDWIRDGHTVGLFRAPK